MGRRGRYTSREVVMGLKLVEDGWPVSHAAQAAGVTPSALFRQLAPFPGPAEERATLAINRIDKESTR